ncbi:MAG: hypothetical protein CML29_04800 [Rhizobiales bacterium]|nr:hypothetical protein [Hyphomicrobiales bacterium]MBA68119.1 hypothetical protein [Hyphomicrobiales bacterium]
MPRFIILSLLLLCAGFLPANADDRDVVPVLRIGLLESHPATADPVKIRTIEQAYEKAIDLPVEIVRFPDLAALIDAHASARVQYAIHTALSFATTQAVCDCVKPLRRALGADGRTGFRSVLALRPHIEQADARVAFSSRNSLSGWVIPREAVDSGALTVGELVPAGSVRAAVDMLVAGEADGVMAWLPEGGTDTAAALPERLFGGLYEEDLAKTDELRIAWLSDPVYNGPHAILRSLPDELVEKLGRFLDGVPDGQPGLLDILEPYESGGYGPAAEAEYRGLERVSKRLREDAPAITGATP